MSNPVSPSFLKQEAKKLAKAQGLALSKAYDEVVKKYGFQNYRHYLNESKKRSPSITTPTIQRRETPLFPVMITSGAREIFKDILTLKDQDPLMAYTGLLKIIKNDTDPFQRSEALQTLINNFMISYSESLSLSNFIPEDYRVMVQPYLKRGSELESM